MHDTGQVVLDRVQVHGVLQAGGERGIGVGVVCNGHQLIAFLASRQDGIPPLDGMGEMRCTDQVSLTGEPLNPLMRRAIREPLDVGVRSINSSVAVTVIKESTALPLGTFESAPPALK